MWTNDQIEKHTRGAALLEQIKNEAFEFLKEKKKVCEHEINDFILDRFKHHGLTTDHKSMIVGFNANAATPHYFPSKNSAELKPETFILIDLWGRLREENSPYADITWVGYFGKNVPEQVQKVSNIVIAARDAALEVLRKNLAEKRIPTGREVDEAAMEKIISAGYRENILHHSGHSLGFSNPHGRKPHVTLKNSKPLKMNIGYTIEPGIYLPNKFGVRSEMNFYIDENFKLVITTPLQKELVMISN